MDLKLEVVVLPVTDVDKAMQFYLEGLGSRLDADFGGDNDYRIVQVTPPQSGCSIIFGTGVTSAQPGTGGSLVLVVDDIAAAREDLVARGVEVSDVFHGAGSSAGTGFSAGTEARVPGPDPAGSSYGSYASFSDPDGNSFLLQEVSQRLPGREWA
jgi:catechol 2,3-dioxygenase-like lactoylglutathione lyase family enzyme